MGFCTSCGGAQEPGTKFCTNCGKRVNGRESVARGTAVQSAPEVTPAATAVMEPSPLAEPQKIPSAPPVIETPQSYPESPFYPDTPIQPGGIGKGLAIVAAIVIVGCALAYFFLAPQKPRGPAPIIDGRQTSSA